MGGRAKRILLALGAALLAAVTHAAAESHPEAVVVVNAASPVSVSLGEYYAKARGIPRDQIARLQIPIARPDLDDAQHEGIRREDFVRWLRDPLQRFLAQDGRAVRVRVLVLVKGVPLRIVDDEKLPFAELLQRSTRASVDAELALLGSGKDGAPGIADMTNPYFDAELPFDAFRARHPDALLRYLVGRIDGPREPTDTATGLPAEPKALVDRALASAPPGRWLIDEDPTISPGLSGANLVYLRAAAAMLRSLGQDVHEDTTTTFVADETSLAGYASWGSNDTHRPPPPYYGTIGGRRFPGRFLPRSIAVDLVSTNARTLSAPPAPLSESEQSLLIDLARLGVAGAAGHVSEPVLAAVPRPYILMRRYAQGVPAGEAYFRSLPYLGWVNVWLGDPLMAISTPASKPSPARPRDLDGDGVPDAADDCTYVPNRDQRDADGDGIGNLCDPDVNQDGVVTPADFEGTLRAEDLGRAYLWLYLPPGPSALRGR